MEHFKELILNFLVTPETSAIAITLAYSMILPVVWLAFCLWLNQEHPRRRGFLVMAFLLGAIVVIPALPLESFLATFSTNNTVLIIFWAACEELLKFSILLIVISQESLLFNGPRDYPIVAITIGLGFAGLENALYILHPALAQNLTQAALSGGMRFFGANLLHAVAVSMSGLALGFAYFKTRSQKILFACIGVIVAIFLHSVFNILLTNADQTQLALAFGFLWGFALLSIILWVYISTMEESKFIKNVWTSSFVENEKVFNELISKINISPDDNTPVREIFSKQKLSQLTSSDYADFEKVCIFLRKSYELHLRKDGMNETDSRVASSHLVSDTVSVKTISAVFNLLKGKDRYFNSGESKIEVS